MLAVAIAIHATERMVARIAYAIEAMQLAFEVFKLLVKRKK